MDALVTDGDLVGAIAGLRGLSSAGVRTMLSAPDRRSAGLLSRHAAGRAIGPDPGVDPEGFAGHVAAAARRHGPLVVFPSREESVDALLAAPAQPGVILPYAGAEALRALRDKRELPALAAEAGLHVPATIAEGAADTLAAQRPGPLPLMVKPVRRGPGLPEVTLARTDAELAAQLAAYPAGEHVVLQEHLDGPLVCLALVVDRAGRVVERYQQQAVRIFPPEAGALAVAVGVAPDEDLVGRAAGLLASAGYWGLAQLDFIQTPDGPRLIDVNPRFYISLGLAVASGVNLPGAWYAVARDRPWPGPTVYPPGRSYRRLESDFAAARRGRPGLLLARPPRPRTGAVWSARDPLPGAWLALRRVTAFGVTVAKRGPAVSAPPRR